MDTPRVIGFDAKDDKGQAVHLTVATDIVDYIEATRVFGREDLADPKAHGRFQPRLIAVPDRAAAVATPMVFTIGNQNGLFLVRKDQGSEGGWRVIDLGKAIAGRVGGSVRTRALGAAFTDDDRIALAVAVDDGPGATRSRVFVAFDLASRTTRWDAIPWVDCGSRANVQVEGIRVLDQGDKTWTVVLAGQNGPNEAVYLLRSDAAPAFDRAPVFNPAVTLEEILDFEAGVHPVFGGGLHVLGTSGGARVLAFRPFPEYDQNGNPTIIPPVVPLPCPAGANVLDVGPTGPDGADLYIGGNGAHVIAAAELDNAQNARLVAAMSPAVAPNVQNLVAAAAADGSAALWALLLNGDLVVSKRAAGTFGASLRLRSNVQEIAPVPGDHHVTTSLLAIYGNSQAAFLWQDAVHQVWQESPLAVADPGKASKVTCYGTSLRVLDGGSVPRPGVKVTVSASALASVMLNGNAAFIGPDIKVDTETDASGAVSIFDRVRSLTPAMYRFDVAGIGAYDVNPAGGIHERFQSMTADELRRATVPVAGGGTAPLLPDEFRKGAKSNQVDVLAGSLNHAAALTSGSRGVAAGLRAVKSRDAFSSTLRLAALPAGYKWGLYADAKGVKPASDDVVNKLIGAAEKVGEFFVGLGESIADFFEGVGHAIQQGWTFVIHKAQDAVRFICAIGDQVKHFVLDTLEQIGSFFTWLWQQVKTGLEKLWDYLKFLFDWDDILRVRDVMLGTIDETLKYLETSIGEMKNPVTGAFDQAIATIDQWRKQAGVPPTHIGPAAKGTSILDKIEEATKPIQELMDKATGNSVVAWVSRRLQSVVDEIVTIEGPNPFAEAFDASVKFAEGVITDEVSDLLQTFESIKADLTRLFGGKLPQAREISFETLRNALIAVGSDLVEGLLRGVRDLVLRLIELAQKLVHAIRDALLVKIRLPFIEDLVKLVTSGKVSVDTSFSLAGALCLLGAIPATIICKLATGHAPFTKGEVITLPFGQVTVQSGADAGALTSAIFDFIVAGIKGTFNSIQAEMALKGEKDAGTADSYAATLLIVNLIPQSLSAINEIVAVAVRSKHTSATTGLDATCITLLVLGAIKTGALAAVVKKGKVTKDQVGKINQGLDITIFLVHLVLKVTDAGLLEDATGGVEETGDKLALVGIGIAPQIKDPKIRAAVVAVALVLRGMAVISSGVRFGTQLREA